MNIGIVDVGTNTILLLLARIDDAGTITPLADEQRTPRLGTGVDAGKRLSPEAMDRAIAVLREYKTMMSRADLSATVVAGTSAVRDAKNREEFADLVRRAVGFELEILGGREEAFWTYKGAVSGLPDIERACVIDIGGGSTEITLGNAHAIQNTRSLDMGSVRLTERYFHHDPPTPVDLAYAREHILQEMRSVQGVYIGVPAAVAVAGTATSLAILDQGISEFRHGAVANYVLRRDAIDALLEKLRFLSSSDITGLSAALDGRSDVITAGTLILSEILSYFGFTRVIVSERGLRYGLALREWEKGR
jgi:exopolyphosphatase/guanosine-5'-triphosphate,3'-diphosphate pyrophosphatase